MGSEERNDKRALAEACDTLERQMSELVRRYIDTSGRGLTQRQIRSELRRRGWPLNHAAAPDGA